MKSFCYLEGNVLPLEEAYLSPRDLGFLRGFSVFDFMPAFHGKPFLFDEHWDRLEMSAKEFGLQLPVDRVRAEDIIHELLEKSEHNGERVIIRTMLTGGRSEDGFSPESGKETFCIMTEPFHALDPKLYEDGARVITLEYERFMPRIKSSNYIFPLLHWEERKKAKAAETLYISEGRVLEAAVSNFFIVKDGTLVTAKDDVLYGITRKLVLRLARKSAIPAEERDILKEELSECQEAFITSSGKDILPITYINDVLVGNGQVGLVTKKLMRLFDAFVESS